MVGDRVLPACTPERPDPGGEETCHEPTNKLSAILSKFGGGVKRKQPQVRSNLTPTKPCVYSRGVRCLTHRRPLVEVVKKERCFSKDAAGNVCFVLREVPKKVCEVGEENSLRGTFMGSVVRSKRFGDDAQNTRGGQQEGGVRFGERGKVDRHLVSVQHSSKSEAVQGSFAGAE